MELLLFLAGRNTDGKPESLTGLRRPESTEHFGEMKLRGIKVIGQRKIESLLRNSRVKISSVPLQSTSSS